RSSGTPTSARRSTAARSTPRANRASRASRASEAAGRAPTRACSKPSASGPAASSARADARVVVAASAASKTSSRRRSPGWGARGGNFQFDEDVPPPRGGDIAAAVTVTLAEAAKGTKRRVQLPTGKEVEVKIPAGLADGQQIRLKGQGLAGARGRAGDVLISV